MRERRKSTIDNGMRVRARRDRAARAAALAKGTAELCCSVRTPEDREQSRDVAGSVASVIVPQKIARKLAISINWSGDAGAGEWLEEFRLREGDTLAAGHGVSIVYASGAWGMVASTSPASGREDLPRVPR